MKLNWDSGRKYNGTQGVSKNSPYQKLPGSNIWLESVRLCFSMLARILPITPNNIQVNYGENYKETRQTQMKWNNLSENGTDALLTTFNRKELLLIVNNFIVLLEFNFFRLFFHTKAFYVLGYFVIPPIYRPSVPSFCWITHDACSLRKFSDPSCHKSLTQTIKCCLSKERKLKASMTCTPLLPRYFRKQKFGFKSSVGECPCEIIVGNVSSFVA